ncbi:glycerol-3-phosphate acyltransferase [Vacuolonema iberomarrocanum]|uniref:glycerol-3-phosphate acyltransferase n=1 Tax=Vacuolonema iberomarrocanum TaxID=3454632 RepID=UPI003F6DDF3F
MPMPMGWAVVVLLVVCPIVGGLPLVAWLTRGLSGKRLRDLGTGNISVSAAFYHGGNIVGILAVLSEALKGIGVVWLARSLFPTAPAVELVALMLLVAGRYGFGRGAGTTNVVWGFLAHDLQTALLVALIGGVGFTLVRERQAGKFGILVLLPVIVALRHPQDGTRVIATALLSLLIAWVYRQIPDDLDLPAESAQTESRTMFKFFRGDRALLSLDQRLDTKQVGGKAATLAQLKEWRYPVPPGWVVPPGDDPAPLLQTVKPTEETPMVVRSSAIGEDGAIASAAGQYDSFLDITNPTILAETVLRCQASYNLPRAVQYRQRQGITDGGMAVLVQRQVQGVFSGVAFSRDPVARQGNVVIVEALPGAATRVVSGRFTPDRYRVALSDSDLGEDWRLPDEQSLAVEGAGDVPNRLVQQVAYLARHLENQFHGIPQDIEWSFDGQQLWLLQSRPITTLQPIWTRKIAAEVIPGFIHPLTWSINRPLTCGVWGEIFTIVLGDRALGLDFTETATLHNSAAYFNATLLGDVFSRMGLPPESLEFLTRGAKFSKPPLQSTLRNVPGLLRLVQQEINLPNAFAKDDRTHFQPLLHNLTTESAESLEPTAILQRIDRILDVLKRTTYYNILAPLGFAARKAIGRADLGQLDSRRTPEVAATRSLQSLATEARPLMGDSLPTDTQQLFGRLNETADGQQILQKFDQFLTDYGYLSPVATDISVSCWREDPQPVQTLLLQFLKAPTADSETSRKSNRIQRRLDLKGWVAEVYNRLLAELRWSFLALEQRWLSEGLLHSTGEIFFLEFDEIRQLVEGNATELKATLHDRITTRQKRLTSDRAQPSVPNLVYGNDPPEFFPTPIAALPASQLRGIGASPGQMEGTVRVVTNLNTIPDVDRDTVLVVPFTDAGWSPLLAQVGGLIAEVGGQLSHGAIVAREYGIPAVMNVEDATQIFRNGQRVRINGRTGEIDRLE